MPIEVSEMQDAVDAKGLAQIFQVHERTSRRWILDGEIESVKIGRKRLVTQRMITDYLERHRSSKPAATRRRRSA